VYVDYTEAAADDPPTWQNNQDNSSGTYPEKGDAVLMAAQGNDDLGLWQAILSTNETGGTWVNYTADYGSPMELSNVSSLTWSNFTWSNSSLKYPDIVGWRIWYRDNKTTSQYNATDILSFQIKDITNPQWQNLGTNDSDDIINQGEPIELVAQGYDFQSLDWAVLSTNETGVFVNYSGGTYDSPIDMGDAEASWTWSNFTWDNSSFYGALGFQIWYNDTAGNNNVTDVYAVTVNDVTAPTITLPVYTNATQYRNDQSMIFNISVIDAGVGADDCNINVDGNANQTLAVSSGWCNGTYALTGISDGNKTINAYSNDTLGNWGLNDSYVVWIDSTAPKWYTPSVNDSNPKPGDLVSHNVNWTDNNQLSWAILEFNRTSPNCDPGLGNATWITLSGTTQWANLTVSVLNTCEGKEIGWRQWVNDSANNWNVTDRLQYDIQNVNPVAAFGTNPVNNYNSTLQSITFDLKVSDNLNVSTLVLYGNWTGIWSANQTNSSPINDTYWNITVNNIPEGKDHVWATWGNDTLGNSDWTDTNRTFSVDVTGPSLSNEGSNETEINLNEDFCLNITATDSLSSVDTVYAEVNDTTATLVNYTMTDTGSTTCDGGNGDDVYGVEIQGVNVGIWNYTKVYANDTFGNMNVNDFTDISINVTSAANDPPTIGFVEVITAKNPTDDTITSITFNFTATDTNGFADINVSTAAGYFNRTGEATRSNTSCVNLSQSGDDVNFSCTIDMWYFDQNGPWTINVTIRDNSDASGENSSTTFTYNTLNGMKMSPKSLTWQEILIGQTNIGSNNDPIQINNTGNTEPKDINVTAYNLRGETIDTEYIFAANFTIENASQGCSGTQMQNATSLNITSAILQRGNHSLNYNNATSGQEQIYFCLTEVPAGISPQPYSSASFGSWEIRILLVAIIPRGRKKKKQKEKVKKRKKIEDDKLTETFRLIMDELKEKYKLSKAETMNLLIKEMRKKYKLTRKEVMELSEVKKMSIPITIFSKELGGLETISKYMKENLEMNYKEIADELNRDERTIWTAYKKAKEKQKEPIDVKKTDIFLPTSILRNRKLTILESIIIYLKEKGMKYSEIAELLERDQRNIWTIYSRAVKKLGK
ncbi:MAG: sigma-70 region 4 domain-containing protein, partial [Patescibacteria group bacterium]|nr:sigma-70 region 4 domain-containing protein [Patescibacteria group bacterium]